MAIRPLGGQLPVGSTTYVNASTPAPATPFASHVQPDIAIVSQAVPKPEQPKAMAALALDLKNGKITPEEAGKRFVQLTVNQQYADALSPQLRRKIEQEVGKTVTQDPMLLSRIAAQLRALGNI